ncbi:hypothetical protein GGF43_001880 [Coemansia sp. RSA 2618]|nr:hypothetical protein GGF43_001880 [Coemansia sp. RSA 2618]
MTIFGVVFLLLLVPGQAQVTTVNTWNVTTPVQAIFPKKTLQTVVVFIPEKDSDPELSFDEATELTLSIFQGYGIASRFNEYSSGAITMTGVDSDPIVTVKYIDEGLTVI